MPEEPADVVQAPPAAPRGWQPRLLLPRGSAVLTGLRWLPEFLPSQTEGGAQPGSWLQSPCSCPWTRLPYVATPGCQGLETEFWSGPCVPGSLFPYYGRGGEKAGRTAGAPSQEGLAAPGLSDVSVRHLPVSETGTPFCKVAERSQGDSQRCVRRASSGPFPVWPLSSLPRLCHLGFGLRGL